MSVLVAHGTISVQLWIEIIEKLLDIVLGQTKMRNLYKKHSAVLSMICHLWVYFTRTEVENLSTHKLMNSCIDLILNDH